MTSYQRRVVISDSPGSSNAIAVSRAPKVKNSYQPRWVREEDISELVFFERALARGALRNAVAKAGLSVGWKKAVETYLGVRVKALSGRRPGSPSRRRQPVIEGAERARIAREVQHELGDPQIYEKLEYAALEKAGLEVGKRRNATTSNDFKIVDTCYREHRNILQSEGAFLDWDEWLKGYKAHAFAQVRSEKSAITRAEALQFYRSRLLCQIKGLAG